MKKKKQEYSDFNIAARQVRAIAQVTFHEILREKILWSSFLFGILCVLLSLVMSRLSFSDNARIALDFGVTSISLVGGLIAIVMGSNLISKELQNRTHFVVLTKPVWRWQFIVGRFFGLLSILFVNILLMTLMLLAIYLILDGVLTIQFLESFILQIIEFAVLASIALIFSTFTTATLSTFFSASIWIVGHAMEDVQILSQKIEPEWVRPILGGVSKIFPNLSRFDIKMQLSHLLPVTPEYFFNVLIYGIVYVAFCVCISCLIFSKREL